MKASSERNERIKMSVSVDAEFVSLLRFGEFY